MGISGHSSICLEAARDDDGEMRALEERPIPKASV